MSKQEMLHGEPLTKISQLAQKRVRGTDDWWIGRPVISIDENGFWAVYPNSLDMNSGTEDLVSSYTYCQKAGYKPDEYARRETFRNVLFPKLVVIAAFKPSAFEAIEATGKDVQAALIRGAILIRAELEVDREGRTLGQPPIFLDAAPHALDAGITSLQKFQRRLKAIDEIGEPKRKQTRLRSI